MPTRRMAFIFPGLGLFFLSLVLIFAGAFWPEIAEVGVFTWSGFLLFFVSLGYVMLKVLGLVFT